MLCTWIPFIVISKSEAHPLSFCINKEIIKDWGHLVVWMWSTQGDFTLSLLALIRQKHALMRIYTENDKRRIRIQITFRFSETVTHYSVWPAYCLEALISRGKKSYKVIFFPVISCDSIMLSACRLVEKLLNMNGNEKVVLFSLQGLMCDTVNFILTSAAVMPPPLKLRIAAGNILLP